MIRIYTGNTLTILGGIRSLAEIYERSQTHFPNVTEEHLQKTVKAGTITHQSAWLQLEDGNLLYLEPSAQGCSTELDFMCEEEQAVHFGKTVDGFPICITQTGLVGIGQDSWSTGLDLQQAIYAPREHDGVCWMLAKDGALYMWTFSKRGPSTTKPFCLQDFRKVFALVPGLGCVFQKDAVYECARLMGNVLYMGDMQSVNVEII